MINRRKFLKTGFLGSCIFVMGGCELFSITTPMQTIKILQYDLFPHAKELGVDVNKYFVILQNHSRIDEDEKNYIKKRVKWLNEESVEMFSTTYIKLDPTKRQKVLKAISQTKWGENWIQTMLSYIMEAVFSDPIYAVSSGDGWKWLNFQAGIPKPKEALL